MSNETLSTKYIWATLYSTVRIALVFCWTVIQQWTWKSFNLHHASFNMLLLLLLLCLLISPQPDHFEIKRIFLNVHVTGNSQYKGFFFKVPLEVQELYLCHLVKNESKLNSKHWNTFFEMIKRGTSLCNTLLNNWVLLLSFFKMLFCVFDFPALFRLWVKYCYDLGFLFIFFPKASLVKHQCKMHFRTRSCCFKYSIFLYR